MITIKIDNEKASIEVEENGKKLITNENSKNLQEENLHRNKINHLYFSGAKLQQTDFREADLQRADFSGAKLFESDFRGADLNNADLHGSNISEADFRGANLNKAELSNAECLETNFKDANLQEANFKGADLRWADLSGADLRKVNFKNADLREVNIDYSCWPLWCGSLDVKIDKRIFCQLLYHTLRAGQSVDDPEVKRIFRIPEVIKLANQFHRADECGKIKS